jgi:hypothetical protein
MPPLIVPDPFARLRPGGGALLVAGPGPAAEGRDAISRPGG